ncbi:uncharacterized protein LOC127565033 [Drosophila albomicans]|uniref:Uncharacterized protein LOC127565033 n=1 Tax=Drosophila albomicans TaxID=7291 RepID=A0A9C6SKW6_DROAB|nr:uncharacterized protein LOC127565033 [Drosophila albomicans]
MLLNNCGQAEESDLIDCSNVSPPRQLRQHFKVGSATGCMQQTAEIHFVSEPSFQVTERSCYFGNVSNKEGCQLFTTLDEAKILTCDICTKDGCNGSASVVPFAGVIIVFLGVARWLV